jgi:glucose/arabinose dehydrogenase
MNLPFDLMRRKVLAIAFFVLLHALYESGVNPFYLTLSSGVSARQQGTFQIDNQFITGLVGPTAMASAPDGRLFVTEQRGTIRVISSTNQLLSAPFLTLSGVRSDGERGLLGIAFDPSFTSNGYLYIFYTPREPTDLTRVSRVTANGNVAVSGSEVILLEYHNFSGNHRGGDIHFGPDGMLYIAIGDAGEPLNGQPVTTLNGKILRINKDGTIPPDNPSSFRDTSGATMTPTGQFRAIWATGLRNPYRFAFNAAGKMHVNDVGGTEWEEVNVVQRGSNYGWPTCEGTCSNTNAVNPIYSYRRGTDGCAITGGTFYEGSQFPSTYSGAYFLIDYCSTWLRYIRPDNTSATFSLVVPQYSSDLKAMPDGSLYVLGYGTGTISRITFSGSGGNQNPVAQATATPASGAPPLNVSLSARGSTDPDGDPLTFSWTFGDGTTGSGIDVSHTYSSSGNYTARVTASDGRGGSQTAQVTVAVGAPPVPVIVIPAQGLQYSAGDSISFSGTATDPDDGALPDSAFSWTVLFHHDAHTHPQLGPLNGVRTGSFTVPTTGHTEDTVFYRIYLTVTDSSGLQTQVTRDVTPRKSRITLDSNVPGTQVLLDGQPRTTPYAFVSVVGISRSIEIVSPQTIGGQPYDFRSWSDGGARSHSINAPATDTTYMATLAPSTGPSLPAPTMQWKFDNSVTESIAGIQTSARGSVSFSSDHAPFSANPASASFDGGAESYVLATGDRIFNAWTSAAAAMWVKVSATTAASWTANSYHTLLSKYRVLQVRILKDASGQLRLTASHSDGTPFAREIVSTTAIPTNAWVHLATVHEGNMLTLYINGQAGVAADTGRPLGGASIDKFDISTFSGQFIGLIDDCRVYDRALSAAQVATLAAGASAPPPPPGAPTNIRIIR